MNRYLLFSVLLVVVTGAPAAAQTKPVRPRWDQTLNICEDCFLGTVPGTNMTPGELRFFEGCPEDRYIRIDDDDRLWDLHTLFFTVAGLTEVELMRVADWVLDLPFPGAPLHPFSRLNMGVRAQYRRLPQVTPVRRLGELVDAFQIPEFSLGDVSAAYNVNSGGVGGIGSGTLFRVNNVIDWAQHVTGDFNQLVGVPLGRGAQGLLVWQLPGRSIDGFQWLITQGFHQLEVMLSRTIDRSIRGFERGLEWAVNVTYTPPYQSRTVFVEMPMEIYRLYESWVTEHYPRLAVGTEDKFLNSTYLQLTEHWSRETALPPMLTVLSDSDTVVLMIDQEAFEQAPAELADYVVPAAWVLNP
jgi:hypothetical protein